MDENNTEIKDIAETEAERAKRPPTPEELKAANRLMVASILYVVLAVIAILLSIAALVVSIVSRFGANVASAAKITLLICAAVIGIVAIILYFPLKKRSKTFAKLLDEVDFPDDLK